MPKMVEIRWHARGGQGAVLASRYLAASAIRENLYFQAFPQFGTERMGAPIVAYTRISDAPINLRCAIEEPDMVVVLDPTLLKAVNVTANLKEGGSIIANYPGTPKELAQELNVDGKFKVYAVDAYKISTEELGRPIPNTPMVGALARVLGLISLDNILAEFEEQFSHRFKPEIVQKNLKAVRRAYEEVQGI
ncbi:pyruvate ferredoxin oxidoreductase, gamma subunit [Thermanaeromonas toyohensis ToBE]|uniref:Pyruvate ferredoxin oxidoreductase, gamma subunit n=1 Tax=Thermanaeromonas toyohensis ToBE TaxID=698762 RepID=A0A1W1V758_9FIRM|nr:2-oxoacid:acceptor oxidoreductase family protein [Thermanaeromonas toyohensis]SMB89192.1 pyruvate ferredoxin oxidoreductase, gamma subunit [Thermanaeromonas toyohensis ToBE]